MIIYLLTDFFNMSTINHTTRLNLVLITKLTRPKWLPTFLKIANNGILRYVVWSCIPNVKLFHLITLNNICVVWFFLFMFFVVFLEVANPILSGFHKSTHSHGHFNCQLFNGKVESVFWLVESLH